jgi:hypothetical protein
MPRKAKMPQSDPAPLEPDAAVIETPPAEATKPVRGVKTAAIKKALRRHKDKSPKEIAELLTDMGIPTKGSQVSNVKSLLASKSKAKTASAPKAKETAAVTTPTDAISFAALQKAKKLIQELGGVANAKQALNALGQLLD